MKCFQVEYLGLDQQMVPLVPRRRFFFDHASHDFEGPGQPIKYGRIRQLVFPLLVVKRRKTAAISKGADWRVVDIELQSVKGSKIGIIRKRVVECTKLLSERRVFGEGALVEARVREA